MYYSRKEQIKIVFAVSLGNLLEWYEIFLFVYWAPLLADLFFKTNSYLVNLTNTFLIFALGFLTRPLGGIFFGRIGDKIGRKKSLILSLVMMIIPTFVIGLLPTYQMIGASAPFILCFMRLLQSFPAGGELPGAFCYLYESAKLHGRKYFCSFGAFGFQVGILISTIECCLLENLLTYDQLISWGWRFSFLFGGMIGLCGLYFRSKLHETPIFRELAHAEKVVKEPVIQVLNEHKKKIFMGVLYCALNSSSFYLLTVNFPIVIANKINTCYSTNLIITAFLLLWVTLPLPLFGLLAEKYNVKKLLVYSTLATLILLYPLYLAANSASLTFMIVSLLLFTLFFTCISALIPYILPDLFHTYIRFTCVGFSFNIADAIIGGFTPVMALFLFNITGNQASFIWILFVCGLLSLIGYLMMNEHKKSIMP